MVLHKSSAAYSCECGASDADGLAMVDTSIEQVAQVRAQRGSGTADTASTARLRTRLSANVAGTICGVAMVRSGPVRSGNCRHSMGASAWMQRSVLSESVSALPQETRVTPFR